MSVTGPIVGDWYRLNAGELFEVVAFDPDDGTIEIQYFDGTLEEMELEDWAASAEEGALVEADPPEDWTGSVDADIDDNARGADALDGRMQTARGFDQDY